MCLQRDITDRKVDSDAIHQHIFIYLILILIMTTQVIIIGAVIVGLSTAYRLRQIYSEKDVRITVMADSFLQQTTSYGSGGLWEPYAIEGECVVQILSIPNLIY